MPADITECTRSRYSWRLNGAFLLRSGKHDGSFKFELKADRSVYFDFYELHPEHQNKGLGSRFYEHCERVWKAAGFDRVALCASMTTGGYVWARKGYGWEFGEMEDDMWAGIKQLRSDRPWEYAEYKDDYGISTFPSSLWAKPSNRYQVQSNPKLVRSLFRNVKRTTTPWELSNIGREAPFEGPDGKPMWYGKAFLLGSDWRGVKTL